MKTPEGVAANDLPSPCGQATRPHPSLLQVQHRGGPEAGGPDAQAPPKQAVSLETVEMDTTPAAIAIPGVAASVPQGSVASMTVEFFLKALKDNSDHVIKSFNASLSSLSQRIDDNLARITGNSAAISEQSAATAAHQPELQALREWVARLEAEGPRSDPPIDIRASLSAGFITPRRSISL